MSESDDPKKQKRSSNPPKQELGETPVAPWDMPTPEEKGEAKPVRRALKDAVKNVDSQEKADEVIQNLESATAGATASDVGNSQTLSETPVEAAQKVQTAAQSATN
ncbi:MAG TPA: hypothetical protein VJ785_14605 [Anaerolineales bacterium]|nr:hypothetical protein [Anaerolineales bacterium]